MQHLITQMMELAHQEAQTDIQLEALNLTEHTRLIIEQLMYQARKKHIDLGLKQVSEQEPDAIMVYG